MTLLDPATMTEAERFAEIAELLARGIQRFLAAECKAAAAAKNSQDPLDDLAASEAPCGSNAMTPKSQEPAA